MNKISLYFLLILIYLGLSKSFAPSEQATSYIANEHALQHSFPGSPISIILTDALKTGFIIHTYFHRYRIVHVFKPAEEIYVRTSEKFWTKHLAHMGMSILRRGEKTRGPTTTPMPPGFLFVGDPAYGSWEYHGSGQRVWQFHNAYKGFPELFGWGDFLVTEDFYQSGLLYLKNDRPYFGPNDEFGTKGKVTQEIYNWAPPNERSFRDTLYDFWSAVKTSLTFESIPAKKSSSTNKEDSSSANLRPAPPRNGIPLKVIKPQLGERPADNGDNKENKKPVFPNLPLREKVDE